MCLALCCTVRCRSSTLHDLVLHQWFRQIVVFGLLNSILYLYSVATHSLFTASWLKADFLEAGRSASVDFLEKLPKLDFELLGAVELVERVDEKPPEKRAALPPELELPLAVAAQLYSTGKVSNHADKSKPAIVFIGIACKKDSNSNSNGFCTI